MAGLGEIKGRPEPSWTPPVLERLGRGKAMKSLGLPRRKEPRFEGGCQCTRPNIYLYLGKKFCQNCRQWIDPKNEADYRFQ